MELEVDAVEVVEADVIDASLKAGEMVPLRSKSKLTLTTRSRIGGSSEEEAADALGRKNCFSGLMADDAVNKDRTGVLAAEAMAEPGAETGEGTAEAGQEGDHGAGGDMGSW